MPNNFQRIVLYYPTIAILNQTWIKQMLLYWDGIGSIVPEGLDEIVNQSDEIKHLEDAGLFFKFRPSAYVEHNDKLTSEFIGIYESDVFEKVFTTIEEPPIQIFRGKLPLGLINYFSDKNLVFPSVNESWIGLNRRAGLLFMSLLAKYLADSNDYTGRIVVPGTDNKLIADMILKNKRTSKGIPGLEFSLQNILPVPREEVEINAILKFKESRHHELLIFRNKILKFQDSLQLGVDSMNQLNDLLARFSDELSSEVWKLTKLMEGEKLSTELRTTTNYIKIPKSVINALSNPITAPINIGGEIAEGHLNLRSIKLDYDNAKFKNLAVSSYSYIYHATKEGIIDTL